MPRDADPEAERDNARIVFLQPNGRVALTKMEVAIYTVDAADIVHTDDTVDTV